jgi:hypothetical protein
MPYPSFFVIYHQAGQMPSQCLHRRAETGSQLLTATSYSQWSHGVLFLEIVLQSTRDLANVLFCTLKYVILYFSENFSIFMKKIMSKSTGTYTKKKLCFVKSNFFLVGKTNIIKNCLFVFDPLRDQSKSALFRVPTL